MTKPRELVLTVRCVSCHHERDIKAGEIKPADFPTCEKCYSIMVPKRARR